MTLRDCPFANTSNAATVAVKKRDVSLLIEKKSVRAIFDVFSRYQSLPDEYMRNLQNDKYDSGRTHPGIDKIKQCTL